MNQKDRERARERKNRGYSREKWEKDGSKCCVDRHYRAQRVQCTIGGLHNLLFSVLTLCNHLNHCVQKQKQKITENKMKSKKVYVYIYICHRLNFQLKERRSEKNTRRSSSPEYHRNVCLFVCLFLNICVPSHRFHLASMRYHELEWCHCMHSSIYIIHNSAVSDALLLLLLLYTTSTLRFSILKLKTS